MKLLKSVAIIGAAVASLSTASLALADTAYENDSGQSAQLSHVMQGKRNQPVNEGGEVSRIQENAIKAYRQRNMLGQSDALSQTKPYTPLGPINPPSSYESSAGETQQSYDSKRNSSKIGNRQDW